MSLKRAISIGFCLVFLCGCAQFNSIYRVLDVTEGKGALIDIKQRAIIVSKRYNKIVVCAEPSPESLSSYAAQLAAEADLPDEITARLVSSFQEGSAFVGMRTPSIQLLRDSLYRICEAYMNGALDEKQYGILMRRYQKYMVALLAIEQLTGTLRSPTVAINTAGSATAAGSVSDLRKELDYIDSNIKDLEKSKNADGVETEEQKNIQSQIDELKKDRKAVEDALKTAQRTASKGSTNVTISSVGTPPQRSNEDVSAVSKVVHEIVMGIIETDDLGQLCFAYMGDLDSTRDLELRRACVRYIQNINDANAVKIESAKLALYDAKNAGKLTSEQLDAIKKLLDSLSPVLKGVRNYDLYRKPQ